MYINYEALTNIIAKYLPENISSFVKNLGNKLKIQQNVNYIQKNRKKVLKNLRIKIKHKKKQLQFSDLPPFLSDEAKAEFVKTLANEFQAKVF